MGGSITSEEEEDADEEEEGEKEGAGIGKALTNVDQSMP
jgi:hypothetical protein